jgi:large subunit ribosomal protein L2
MIVDLYKYYFDRFFFGLKRSGGRNFSGCITVFHRGGGLKRRVRVIDYYRDVNSFGVILFIVEGFGRFGFLGLVCYFLGFFSLILAVDGMYVGQRIYSGHLLDNLSGFSPLVLGSAIPLFGVGLGSVVCLLELRSRFGFQLLRSAGV